MYHFQITPLLLKYKREALEEGLPLVRPLWLEAGSEASLLVKDEFTVGDEIVVAPVLYSNQTTREGKYNTKQNLYLVNRPQTSN